MFDRIRRFFRRLFRSAARHVYDSDTNPELAAIDNELERRGL